MVRVIIDFANGLINRLIDNIQLQKVNNLIESIVFSTRKHEASLVSIRAHSRF